MTIPKN